MRQNTESDARPFGYFMVFIGLVNAGQAVDRIFFDKTVGAAGRLNAITALICLAGGTWMIINRRAPFGWIEDWVAERWGRRGTLLVTAVFAAVVIAGVWGLSRP